MFNLFKKNRGYSKFLKNLKSDVNCFNFSGDISFIHNSIKKLVKLLEDKTYSISIKQALLEAYIEIEGLDKPTFRIVCGENLIYNWAWNKCNREYFLYWYQKFKEYYKKTAEKMLAQELSYPKEYQDKMYIIHLRRIIEDNLTPYYITHLINRNNEKRNK